MMNLSRWKIGLVLIAVIGGILLSLPNFLPAGVRDSVRNFLPTQTLNLGLDLQGGSYLLMEVDTNALTNQKANQLLESVRDQLDQASIAANVTISGTTVTATIKDPSLYDQAVTELNKLSTPLPKSPGLRDVTVSKGANQTVTLTLTRDGLTQEASSAVDNSLEIIRRRIDKGGAKEISIVRQGANRIVIEAPGETDPEHLKKVIGQTANLTFQMVDETVSPGQMAANQIPPGSILLPDEEHDGQPSQIVVRKKILVSGADLKHASVGQDQNQRTAIDFSFNGSGAQKFGKATSENVGHRFAIILDGTVISAPVINSPITGGSGIIQGNFTVQSASDLVNMLNGGALPAPLKFVEQRTVTASLGADTIQRGAHATIIAFCAVVAFMLLAYGFQFGGYSILSLLTNLVMLIGGMSLLGSTLTLPGIAGLILTLAMAVDANVLIYERMRDEMRSGKSLINALDSGFAKALETILDANITTLVAALIMYSFGAGTVKGFAITLMLGTFTSVFSSVMITQVCVAAWYKLRRPKVLPIADDVAPKAWPLIKALPKKTDIHFVNFARLAATLSVIGVCASLFLTVVGDQAPLFPLKAPCGGLTCGVDFKGGTKLEMTTGAQQIDLASLRTILGDQGLKDVQVQGAGNAGNDVIMKFESPTSDPVGKVEGVKSVLMKTYTQAKFSNTEVVGAEVSGELLTSGIMALFIAIGLMMIYIWFRFEWQFGLGAVFALFHDVILTFGLFAVFHLEFDLRAVAAILTIIGYSMNDTVVVFDRLRENLRKYKKMPLSEVINLSINETLSRTIITGLTAVMALAGLAILGGEALLTFSVAMMFGIVVGTYSSIYVAAPVILLWGVNRNAGDAEVIDLGGFKNAGKKQKQMP